METLRLQNPVCLETAKQKFRAMPLKCRSYTPKIKDKRPAAPPTDTSLFDELLNWLYREHGIFAIHLQDERVSEHLRDLMLLEGNRRASHESRG